MEQRNAIYSVYEGRNSKRRLISFFFKKLQFFCRQITYRGRSSTAHRPKAFTLTFFFDSSYGSSHKAECIWDRERFVLEGLVGRTDCG